MFSEMRRNGKFIINLNITTKSVMKNKFEKLMDLNVFKNVHILFAIGDNNLLKKITHNMLE